MAPKANVGKPPIASRMLPIHTDDRWGGGMIDAERLLHAFPVAACVIAWSTGGPEIVWRNPQLEALFGREIEIGSPVLELLREAGAHHPAQAALERESVIQAFVDRPMRLDDLLWLRDPAGERAMRVSFLPMEGERFQLAIVLEDVTDWAAGERAQDAFVAAGSHELKTPVTVIRGLAELLRETADKASPEELARGLDEIIDRTSHLARIIDSLLDLTRLKMGMFQLELVPVHLPDLIDGLVADAGYDIQRDLAPDAEQVLSDPRLLGRALRLLFDNAAQHGAPPIVVRSRRSEVGLDVSVLDHGDGIPEPDRHRLFLPFLRSMNRLGSGEGSGLGLPMIQALAAAIGARVLYEEHEGAGAWLTLRFPTRT